MKNLRRLGCITVLACCGCADDPEWWWEGEADFEWHGAHVTISGFGREEVDACGSSFVMTDEYVATLIDFHGVDAPVHVDYDWFSEATWAETQPCRDVYACTGAGRIVTRDVVHSHELGHAVSWEGLACTWVYSPRECGYRELSGTHAFIFFLPADQQREVTVRIRPTGFEFEP